MKPILKTKKKQNPNTIITLPNGVECQFEAGVYSPKNEYERKTLTGWGYPNAVVDKKKVEGVKSNASD